MPGRLRNNAKFLQSQLGDAADALDLCTEFVELAGQERLQSRIQAGRHFPRLAQGLLDSKHLYAHAVGVVCRRNLLQPVTYGRDQELYTLQCLIGCHLGDQLAAGRGSLGGAKPSVVDYPARLCNLAVDDLEPRRQKALALAMDDECIAQMASF